MSAQSPLLSTTQQVSSSSSEFHVSFHTYVLDTITSILFVPPLFNSDINALLPPELHYSISLRSIR